MSGKGNRQPPKAPWAIRAMIRISSEGERKQKRLDAANPPHPHLSRFSMDVFLRNTGRLHINSISANRYTVVAVDMSARFD